MDVGGRWRSQWEIPREEKEIECEREGENGVGGRKRKRYWTDF